MNRFGIVRRRQRLRGAVVAAAGLACLALASAAGAQHRPLVTEGPEVIGAGRVLVETGVEYGGGLEIPVYGLSGNLWRVPALGARVGLGSIVEFQLGSGYRWMSVTRRGAGPLAHELEFSGDSTSSIEDVVFATKIRMMTEGARRPSFGLRFATKLPSARNETGLGTDMTDVSVALLAGKTVRSIRIVGNLGMAIISDPTQLAVQYDPLLFGIALGRRVGRGVDLVGEIEGRWQAYKDTPQPAAENRAALRAGLRYALGAARVDAAISTGFGDIEPHVGFTTGVTWVFDVFRMP